MFVSLIFSSRVFSSYFLASGGKSIGASVSASVIPMNFQVWFPLGLTVLISLQSKGHSRLKKKKSNKHWSDPWYTVDSLQGQPWPVHLFPYVCAAPHTQKWSLGLHSLTLDWSESLSWSIDHNVLFQGWSHKALTLPGSLLFSIQPSGYSSPRYMERPRVELRQCPSITCQPREWLPVHVQHSQGESWLREDHTVSPSHHTELWGYVVVSSH